MSEPASLDFLTVEEVAAQLRISIATVRRRCGQGEWGAQKAGKQWLIPASAVALTKPQKAARPQNSDVKYDLNQAFRFIQTTDMSEAWVPDVLRFRDIIENSGDVISEARSRLERDSYGPAIRLPIPKPQLSSRPGVLLEMPDRIAYQAVASKIAQPLQAKLIANVFSCRLSGGTKYFLEHGSKKFVRFEKITTDRAKKYGGWVAKTDITAYFEHVLHNTLFEELANAGISGPTLRSLRVMLSKWALVPGIGLPQGPNASRILGNFYLSEVDHEMVDSGYDYYRYMDDIRILADSKVKAVEGLRLFEQLCRRRGLTISSSKTAVVSAEQYVAEASDSEMNKAAYLFDKGDLPKSRIALCRILRKALSQNGISIRRLRFSMWRLAKIRESSILNQILGRLEELAPVASLTAAYLKHFIERKSVQAKICEFLEDESRSYSHHLRTWIFAVILESREISTDLRKIAEAQTRDRNAPAYLRSIAACVLAKGRVSRDLRWIKSELAIEHDPAMVRGYLAALTYASSLDKQTISDVQASNGFRTTFDWLRARKSMPSLVYPDKQIEI